ncbi:MAG TPA: hypothetical protein VHS13_11060 [Edaphobacter sp.]|jgi:hypothetical protein|nr:hypothetical protein [Edaphobacter sp.]
MIGIGVLCFSALLFYDYSGLGSNGRPPAALVWIVFGSGFVLTGGGLIFTTLRLDRKGRIILAISLLSFGIISFVLALAIAHVGPVLMVFAFPAVVFGTIVGLMAVLFQRLSSEPRSQ